MACPAFQGRFIGDMIDYWAEVQKADVMCRVQTHAIGPVDNPVVVKTARGQVSGRLRLIHW